MPFFILEVLLISVGLTLTLTLEGMLGIGIFVFVVLVNLVLIYSTFERGRNSVISELNQHLPPALVGDVFEARNFGIQVSSLLVDAENANSVLSSIQEGVVAIDIDGRIRLYNEAAERIIGPYTQGGFIEDLSLSKKILRMLDPESVEQEYIWRKGKNPKCVPRDINSLLFIC